MSFQILLQKYSQRVVEEAQSQQNSTDRAKAISSSPSISIPNEMPVTQFQKSYFAKEIKSNQFEDMAAKKSDIRLSNISKISKLDDQLKSIEKMKNIYQSKQRLEKNLSHSIERSSINKSIEKHSLKPSHVPQQNLIAFEPSPFEFQESQESMNIYTNWSERPHSNLKSMNSIHKNEEHSQIDFYENKEENSKQDEIFSNKSFSMNTIIYEKKRHDSKKSNEQKQSSESDERPQRNLHVSDYQSGYCCEEATSQFMGEVEQKMKALLQRMEKVEQRNQLLHHKNHVLQQVNSHYEAKIQSLQTQNQQLSRLSQTTQFQKNYLESLLKDALFQRERHKLSKENINQIQHTSSRIQNVQVGSKEMQARVETRKPEVRNKNKVKEILQKLQIKVEKS